MSVASSTHTLRRGRFIGGLVVSGALALSAAPAHAASERTVRLQPEGKAKAASIDASAAGGAPAYVKLSKAGVTAGDGTLDGRKLTVRIQLKKRVGLRLAIAIGKKTLAFRKLVLNPGKYRIVGNVSQSTTGKNLRLRVTARISIPRKPDIFAREFRDLKLKVAGSSGPPANSPPTALALSDSAIAENLPSGSAVGTLQGTDADATDTLTYALVAGAGSTDNAAFTVAGSVLKTAASFDFEARSSYAIRVRVSDGRGGTFERAFAVTVTNVNEAPTALTLSGTSVAENAPVGTTVGTLSAADPDAGSSFTYALVGGDTAPFMLLGDSLRTAVSFDRETKDAYSVSVRVTDAAGASLVRTFAITVTDVNEAPSVLASGGALAYTENDPATVLDPGVAVSDVDSATLSGASVQLTGGLEATDALVFVDQAGITGAYDAPTGRLSLGGSASVAAYQAALRSVRYRSTSDDPATSKTASITVTDGALTSPAATKAITVTKVNDTPVLTTSTGPLAYTEGDAATAIDPGLALTDPDSQIQSATVKITGNFAGAEDVLDLPATAGITKAYDAGTGTLTLTGPVSPAAFQAALRTVTYRNTANNPAGAPRTVTFTATDGTATSAAATRAIAVTPVDNAPDVSTSAGSTGYTENAAGVAIDTALTLTDPDSGSLTGATVQVTGNFAAGQDVLGFVNQNGITGQFNAGTGRLTLSGTATLAQYQAALRSVTYLNASDNPSTANRTITFTASDATGFGASATKTVTVTATDDAPTAVADAATVGEDSGAGAIAVLLNDTDVDGGPKSIASVTQPADGTVVITGGGTGLTYAPDADFCNSGTGGSPDTFTYTLTPGSSSTTVSITVSCVDDPPVAVADSFTVGEDSGATAIDVLANDTDIDGGPKVISGATQPAHGLVTNAGPTGLSYKPAADYCNTQPGGTPDTFTYSEVPGNTSATVSITVTCVDDAPVAVDDSATVDEDSGANVIAVLANDADVDSGPISITAVTQPGNGTAVITGGGTGVSYTPNADYCNSSSRFPTFDTFDYTLSPGGDTGTVAVTVTCENDPPAVTTSGIFGSYTENDQPVVVDGSVTVTDVDGVLSAATATIIAGAHAGDTLSVLPGSPIAGTVNAAGDAVTFTGPGSPGDFQEALRHVAFAASSDDPTGANRTIAFGVDDGTLTDSDQAVVTVTPVDDAPVAVDDSLHVDEDQAATALEVPILANDTDPDGGPIAFASASDPAHGTVVLSGGSLGASTTLTYQPDPDYCNDSTTPDTFTYTLAPGGSTATVDMIVDCVDDAPETDLNGPAAGSDAAVTFTENDAPVAIAPAATVTDIDDENLESATVALTGTQDAGEALAADTTGTSIGASFSGGTLTLTGTDTKAHYQQVLRSVTYTDPATPPQGGARTATVRVDDGTAVSAPHTSTITVKRANFPPAVDLNGSGAAGLDVSAAYTEDGPAVAIAPDAEVSDVDDATLSSAVVIDTNRQDGAGETLAATTTGTSIVGFYNPATGILTLQGVDTVAHYQQVLRSVRFEDTSDTPGTTDRVITVKVNDGKDDSNVATSTLSVTPHNDAPSLDLDDAAAGVDTSVAFREDDPALTLAPRAAVRDPDSPALASATITLTSRPDGSAESLTADATGTAVTVGAYNPASGVLQLTGPASGDDFQQVLRTVRYANTSQNPDPTARQVTFSLSDGTAASPATATVTVTPVNDPPVVRLSSPVSDDATAAFTETSDSDAGSGPVTIAPIATIDDPDSATLTGVTVTLTNRPQGLLESLSATAGGGVSVTAYDPATGRLVLTGAASPTAYQAVLRTVKYNNLSDTPTATDRIVTVTATDGAATSAGRTSTVSVTPTNDAPTATAKSYAATPAVHNTSYVVDTPADGAPTVTGAKKSVNLLAGATNALPFGNTDPDGPAPTVVAETKATSGGGTVTIEADGDFTYLPAFGCSATTDSFTYTVTDNAPASPKTATATVSLALSGCVYYVDNTKAGNGTSTSPFATTAQAQSAGALGSNTVYVYKGNGTSAGYDTSFVMATNQSLIGEIADLVIGGSTLAAGTPGNRPLLTTTSSASVVLMGNGDVLRGLQLDPNTNSGISMTSTAGGTIDDVRIIDTGVATNASAIRATNTTGTWDVSDLVIDNTGTTSQGASSGGISLTSAGTWNFKDTGKISVKIKGGRALDTSTTGATMSFGTNSVFDDITGTGSNGGVSVANTTGNVTFGDGIGVDLDLTTTSGTAATFSLLNAGGVTIPAAGTAVVSSQGAGTGVSSSGTPGPALNFDRITVSGSGNTTNGVTLSGLGTGTFTANSSSTISNTTGTDFVVDGGIGNVTYDGTITDNTGRLVSVTNTTGGTKTFGGALSDAGGGVAGTGVSLTNNTGATIALTGGMILGSTGASPAFTATGGGTITTAGVNTVSTTTGTGVDVENTTIGAGGVTFQSVSTNGATSGIVLSNTGAGPFVVTGNGGGCDSVATTCSGGTIQSSTGPGVSLANVAGGVSLTRMRIASGADDGIRGAGVAGFSLSTSAVTGNGNAQGESGLDFGLNGTTTGLTGTAALVGDTVTDNYEDNVSVENGDNATLALTVDGGTYARTNAAAGNDGIFVRNYGTSGTTTATVKNAAFTDNRGDHVQMTTGANAGAGLSQTLTVDNDTMSTSAVGNGVLGGGVTFNPGGATRARVTVSNNTIQKAYDSAIVVSTPGTATAPQRVDLAATIANNTIGTAGTNGSGSQSGDGIYLNVHGGATARALITGNRIFQWENLSAIDVRNNDTDGTLDLTVAGNTLASPNTGANPLHGLQLLSGLTGSTDQASTCADIGGAAALSNTLTGSGVAANGGQDIRVRAAGSRPVTLPGLLTPTAAGAQTFIQARNSAGNTTLASVNGAGTFANTTGGAGCAQP